jgi:hypothetical protein
MLEENLPQCRFIHHNFHVIYSELELGLLWWESGN